MPPADQAFEAHDPAVLERDDRLVEELEAPLVDRVFQGEFQLDAVDRRLMGVELVDGLFARDGVGRDELHLRIVLDPSQGVAKALQDNPQDHAQDRVEAVQANLKLPARQAEELAVLQGRCRRRARLVVDDGHFAENLPGVPGRQRDLVPAALRRDLHRALFNDIGIGPALALAEDGRSFGDDAGGLVFGHQGLAALRRTKSSSLGDKSKSSINPKA